MELKGLAHKKNERNVEYSFEVSFGDFNRVEEKDDAQRRVKEILYY